MSSFKLVFGVSGAEEKDVRTLICTYSVPDPPNCESEPRKE